MPSPPYSQDESENVDILTFLNLFFLLDEVLHELLLLDSLLLLVGLLLCLGLRGLPALEERHVVAQAVEVRGVGLALALFNGLCVL